MPGLPAIFAGSAVMAVVANTLVILGPTASGKSELALRVARRVSGEILSVDSMTVYRGMDVGTAKPTPQERAEILHHLLDVVEANETFTAARFVELADAVIADAKRRGVPLIATGGTPLYYKALFEGMFEGPGADADLRAKLAAIGNEQLHARLARIDPAAAQRIHVNDTKRLVRALEVFELTGKPISSLQTEWTTRGQRHDAVWFGLLWDKDALNRRINTRVKTMIAAGWLDEARRLLERCGDLSMTAVEATGYHELIQHLRGRISLDDAIEQIKIGTRQLARRQMKWFKRFPNVEWLRGDAPVEENVERIVRRWIRDEAPDLHPEL
jgi:tRNA dimethylallyltransferase